ncbi:hypothetical protein N7478_000605 [Penicillium angulare]|uniref:uncharacterized protein n=1 Tax=Penicillium angulare TaxID=116970 RepID=UPI00253FFA21|nr:uncharacterized protein N7478_000605 [Penicillium angulare]KAJ5291354.1 hypothetical protein N7478_000605 [Penicillium angulare]
MPLHEVLEDQWDFIHPDTTGHRGRIINTSSAGGLREARGAAMAEKLVPGAEFEAIFEKMTPLGVLNTADKEIGKAAVSWLARSQAG